MGAQFPFSIKIPVRQSSRIDRAGAGDCLPRHRYPPDQQGGIYTENKYGKTRFQQAIAPSQQELPELVHTISHRVAGFLERQGILE